VLRGCTKPWEDQGFVGLARKAAGFWQERIEKQTKIIKYLEIVTPRFKKGGATTRSLQYPRGRSIKQEKLRKKKKKKKTTQKQKSQHKKNHPKPDKEGHRSRTGFDHSFADLKFSLKWHLWISRVFNYKNTERGKKSSVLGAGYE